MYQSRIRDAKKRNTEKHCRYLELPEDDQEFAVVVRLLGNGRVQALFGDGEERQGRIRGSMRKYRGRVLIENNDLILVARRDFDDKFDVISKYTYEETLRIQEYGWLPKPLCKALNLDRGGGDAAAGGNESYVVFADGPGGFSDEEGSDVDVGNI